MRRALIGQRNGAAGIGLALGLAGHQQADAPLQPGQRVALPGHHLREILGQPGGMRQRLLQMAQPRLLLVHAPILR